METGVNSICYNHNSLMAVDKCSLVVYDLRMDEEV